MELEIQVVLATIILLSLLFILLTLLLIYRNWQKQKVNEEMTAYINYNLDQWFHHLFHGHKLERVTTLKSYESKAVEKIFFTFLNNGYSNGIDVRIETFATAHFAADYRQLFKHGRWAERVNTLNKIIQFKMPGFTELYTRKKIMRLSRYEYFLYLTYLSIFDITKFIKVFFMRKDLSEYEYKKIFNKLDDGQTRMLSQHFSRMSDAARHSMIGRVSYISAIESIIWLEALLDHEEAEIRIRALKGIKTIGMIHRQEKYLHFINSSIWEERMLIMRLSPLVGEAMIPSLIEALDDENEWVKNAAGGSLGHFQRQLKDWTLPLNGRSYNDGVE